jgi:microcystin-dependent protein
MAEPFLSEIRIMSFGYAPRGWALCDGQFLPINQNQALFSLLGTTYGGNGQTTFELPDLRGRTPIHLGNGHTLGEKGGEQAHTVSTAELPTHTHILNATSAAATGPSVSNPAPSGTNLLATSPATDNVYNTPSSVAVMDPSSIGNVGGSQAHMNMQPFLTLSFCIALQGIFPSQN